MILAICVSVQKGTAKQCVEYADLKCGHGIVGDAHAGDWHRQISLLSEESVLKLSARFPGIQPGAFAENILLRGLRLHELPIGTTLRVGCAELEITQIGKECHSDCDIRRMTGDCVMPREGVFAVVTKEGRIYPGDETEVL